MLTENEFSLSESPSAHEDPPVDTNPAPDIQAEPDAPNIDPSPAAEDAPAAPAETKKPKVEGVVKRIGELTAQRHAEKQGREAAEARAAQLEALLKAQGVDVPEVPSQGQPRASITQADVDAAAAQQIAVRDFNKKCDDTFNEGVKAHGDAFKASVDTLNQTGVLADISFLETVLETGAAPAVLHYLGQDPDEALRLSELPPIKRAIEIDRLARELNTPKPAPAPAPVSKAPAPITPIAGTRAKDTVDLNDPETPDDVWFAEMTKRDRARA